MDCTETAATVAIWDVLGRQSSSMGDVEPPVPTRWLEEDDSTSPVVGGDHFSRLHIDSTPSSSDGDADPDDGLETETEMPTRERLRSGSPSELPSLASSTDAIDFICIERATGPSGGRDNGDGGGPLVVLVVPCAGWAGA